MLAAAIRHSHAVWDIPAFVAPPPPPASVQFLIHQRLFSSTGTICLISIYGTHHNPAVWTEPEVQRLLFGIHSPVWIRLGNLGGSDRERLL